MHTYTTTIHTQTHIHMQTTQELIIFNTIFVVMFLQVKVESIPVLDPHPNQITIKLHVSLQLV